MNRFKGLWLFPVFINLLMYPSCAQHQLSGKPGTDNLRQEITNEKKSGQITSQPELGVPMAQKRPEEAQRLVRKALASAQKTGNKNLEMRSYYSLGRIVQTYDKIKLSQAYYDSALVISETIDDNFYKGEILFRKGINQHNTGKDLQALQSFHDAVQASRLSKNFKVMGSSYSMMGNTYRLNGLYDRAIEYTIKAKLNYEKAGYVEGYAWSAYLLGRIYVDLKLPQRAKEYFEEALGIYQKTAAADGNEEGMALCYEQIGMLNMESGNLTEASKNIQFVLRIYSENGSEVGKSNAFKNLGLIEYFKGNFIQAEAYLNQALTTKNKIGDLLNQPSIYEYLGLCALGRGLTEKGFNNLHRGLELALSNKQKKIQLEIYSKLTEAYLNSSDFKNAVSSQKKEIEIQNSLLSGAAKIKMEQLQTIYEIDEKNSQIAELERQNEVNDLKIRQHRTSQILMISGIFLTLFTALVIYFFYNKIRRKNRELKKAIATKDKLFSIVAHDLRGPIGSALGLSELLIEGVGKKDLSTIEKYALVFHQSLNDTFTLLNNLLDWSRSQLQRIEFNPQSLLLNDIVDETINLLASSVHKKNIILKINIEKTLQLTADKEMLKTILRNLISNAIKYSNPEGKITIFPALKGQFIELSVQDNGVGMSTETISKLFNLESNASTPGTFGERGTGLGLILAKEFTEKHGGQIQVESTPGEGSIFILSLPVKPGTGISDSHTIHPEQ